MIEKGFYTYMTSNIDIGNVRCFELSVDDPRLEICTSKSWPDMRDSGYEVLRI